ncbi:hypothetical protein V2J09_023249 [Rumex salicifolius]
MGCAGGDDVDTGADGDELGLLGLLDSAQVGHANHSASAQLPFHGFRYGQGLRLVFRRLPPLFSYMDRRLSSRLPRLIRLRPPVAPHLRLHLLALFPGQNFPSNRSLALSLSISFNGLTAAIYTLIVNAINSDKDSLYLLLNALIPLLTSIISLIPISYHQRKQTPIISTQFSLLRPLNSYPGISSFTFVVLYSLAVFTGLYVIFLNLISSTTNIITGLIFLGAILLLFLIPLLLLGLIYGFGHGSQCKDKINSLFEGISFNLVEDLNDLHHDIHKELVEPDQNVNFGHNVLLSKDRILSLGEEHSTRILVRRWDFWLYFLAYLGGGTIGLAYSNNLGQIVQSLGFNSNTTFFVSIYSTCSFFGRLLASAPDFLSNKLWFARTGWLAMSIVPTPIAFFLLVASGSWATLCISTILIGLSSGYVFAAAVSVTSELFGPQSAGINHNILITNIPIGSLLYGILVAVIYDSNAGESIMAISDGVGEEMTVLLADVSMVWLHFLSGIGLQFPFVCKN